MKTYTEHIFEELIDNSPEDKIRRYLERKRREAEERKMNRPCPESKEELQDMIVKAIEEKGPEVDLNYIDVSGIDDMYFLFHMYHGGSDIDKNEILQSFNGDISEWNVSRVEDMSGMFSYATNFNGDISDWDVSRVTNMNGMFWHAESFNCGISDWDVSRVEDMSSMFCGAKNFNQDLSSWDFTEKDIRDIRDMFKDCPIAKEYKPKGLE